MSIGSSTIVPFRCAECAAEFGPGGGGQCERCGRLLCSRHLFGAWPARWFKPQPRICQRCRTAPGNNEGKV